MQLSRTFQVTNLMASVAKSWRCTWSGGSHGLSGASQWCSMRLLRRSRVSNASAAASPSDGEGGGEGQEVEGQGRGGGGGGGEGGGLRQEGRRLAVRKEGRHDVRRR